MTYLVIRVEDDHVARQLAAKVKGSLEELVEVYTFADGQFLAHWRPTAEPGTATTRAVPGRAR